MRPLLLSLLLVPLASAQAPYDVERGDYIRLGLPDSGALLEGRIVAVGVDSLSLAPASGGASRWVVWQDVERLERREENRVGETAGVASGLFVGAVVGGLIAELVRPHSFAYLSGGLLGGLAGMPVGAVVGANTGRPWVDLPRGDGGPSISLRFTLR